MTYLFDCTKATEGGIAQAHVSAEARALGLRVSFGQSAYVGHYSVYVNTRDKRKQARLARRIGMLRKGESPWW